MIDHALLIRLVERIQAAGEEREGCARKHALGAALLEVVRQIEHGITGGDDVVRDEDVLARHVDAHVLVRDDRVAPVHHAGVIATLIEHAQVDAHGGAVIDIAANRALIRGDDHHVILVDLQVVIGRAHGLEHLIGRHDALKAVERDRVLHARVVRIEGDDVGDAHGNQLLKHQRAVHGLTRGAAMLASFVEHRHDDVDALRLPADRRDDALEVSVVLVRRHRHIPAVELVCALIRADVADDIQIISAHRIQQHPLAFAGAKARAVRTDQKAVGLRAVEAVQLFVGAVVHLPPGQVIVDSLAHLLAAAHGDDAQRCNRHHREFLGRFSVDVLAHNNPFLQ